MKKIIILTLFFSCVMSSVAQTKPKSIIELGGGLGPNYSVIGGKLLLGYKGNGILFGIGAFEDYNYTNIGIQISLIHLFASFSRLEAIGSNEYHGDNGTASVFMFGGRIPLGKNNRIILDPSMGVAKYDYTQNTDPVFGFGISYKLLVKND